MGKTGQRVLLGCLVFLCLIVVWEIIATFLYRNHVQKTIQSHERFYDAGSDYIPYEERMENYQTELELEGNPYSLFR